MKYSSLGFSLGLVWYFALLLPVEIRTFIHPATVNAFGMNRFEVAAVMCLSSLGLAIGFKKLIIQCNFVFLGFLAIVMPFIGSVLFMSGCLIFLAIREGLGGGDIPSAYAGGISHSFKAYYVTYPVALIGLLLLKRIGGILQKPPDERTNQ